MLVAIAEVPREEWGEKVWDDYVNMRDYLNVHEKIAKEYSDLKERLANEYSENRQSYTKGKNALIESILRSAEELRKH